MFVKCFKTPDKNNFKMYVSSLKTLSKDNK